MPLLIRLRTGTQKYFAIFDHNLTDKTLKIGEIGRLPRSWRLINKSDSTYEQTNNQDKKLLE